MTGIDNPKLPTVFVCIVDGGCAHGTIGLFGAFILAVGTQCLLGDVLAGLVAFSIVSYIFVFGLHVQTIALSFCVGLNIGIECLEGGIIAIRRW